MISRTTKRFVGILICLSLASIGLLPSQAASEDPSIGAELEGKNFVDIDGHSHNTREWVDKKVVVFVFIGIDCPISNRYAPELNAIYHDFSRRGLSMYGVLSDRTVTEAEARKHSTDFALQFPVLIDSSIELAKILGAKITPEAVVLTAKGVPIYRGRIDNTYITFGQMRNEPTVTDLRTVLDRAVQGITEPYRYTPSIGCSIPLKER